jgi:hypothetical protein
MCEIYQKSKIMSYLKTLEEALPTGPFKAMIHEHSVLRHDHLILTPGVTLDVLYADMDAQVIVKAELHEPGGTTLLDDQDIDLLERAGILGQDPEA